MPNELAAEDLEWNLALLAMGREWQRHMIHYCPEDLHDIRKAIYALWRGNGLGADRAKQPENEAVCHAIDVGMRDT